MKSKQMENIFNRYHKVFDALSDIQRKQIIEQIQQGKTFNIEDLENIVNH